MNTEDPGPETPPPLPPRSWMPRFSSPLARLLLIAVLMLLLNIPLGMIHGVVEERAERRGEAISDIFAGWGAQQSLTGPLLRVPFAVHRMVPGADGKLVQQDSTDAAYFLPRELHVDGKLGVEMRHRGIFEMPVYVAHLHLSGQFERPDFTPWSVKDEDVDWKHAELVVGLAEPRTLQADAALNWGGQALRFKPSTGHAGQAVASGIHVPLGQELAQLSGPDGSSFSIQLSFNGAGALSFTPTAEQTDVTLAADWPHPSFQGGWLPAQREVRSDGFSAQWSVSYLGRDYPQHWTEQPTMATMAAALSKSQFGVTLMQPVDPYVTAERVLKYAVLTLLFTFAVIWLTEVLSGQTVHPIQYAFIGAALCLFGLLQLSFAEHFGFTVAFVVAALAVVAMITLYCLSLLRHAWQALAVGGVLGGLYAYLYSILRAEDHALLGGSIALFIGLGVAMFLTRRVDWSALGRRPVPLQ